MTKRTESRDGGAASVAGSACPICRKPTTVTYRPFCSKRCADVDLQRWFTGRYAVPVVEEDRSVGDDDAEG